MLQDIIYRASTVDKTQPTRLLPYDFLRKYIPLSLDVKDTFNLRGHVPIDKADLTPRRVFYLEDIDCYLLLDVGDPAMAVIYLLDAKTREIRCSYTYLVESYLYYKQDDEIADICVHHTNMQNHVTVTFLLINNRIRSSTIATYNLEYGKLGEPHNEIGAGPVFYLELLDLVHFADVIPPGKHDEIALGYEEVGGHEGDYGKSYPKFLVEEIVPTLKSRLFIGTLVAKYSNITCDDKGRFFILLGTTINVWMGPFLQFPVDAQYIIVMDKGGMNIKFTLLSPTENAMSFDEHQENQPYKYSLSSWDGRYLICLEDRKSRYLSPALSYSHSARERGYDVNESDTVFVSNEAWGGGVVADKYYPMRGANTDGSKGYCTQWADTSYLDPVQRETVWVVVDACDVLEEIEPEPVEIYEPPITADIVFLIDDSNSMQPAIDQVKANVASLSNRLMELDIDLSDVRYGALVYQNNVYHLNAGSPVMVATTGVELMLLPARASAIDPSASPRLESLTQLARGFTKGVFDTLAKSVDNTTARASYNFLSLTDPWNAIDTAATKYPLRSDALKVFILVTDTNDEVQNLEESQWYQQQVAMYGADVGEFYKKCTPSSSHTALSALSSLTAGNITLCVASPKWCKSTYDPLVEGTGGVHINMEGNWGKELAISIAEMIGAKIDRSKADPNDWFAYITHRWGPAIHYHYSPALDFEANSLITIFHDDVTFMVNGAIVRNQINWLTCYDNYPQLGGEAQDSFYMPSLIPGEAVTQLFVVRNESYTGTMKQIQLQLLDKPDDVDITIKNWPTELKHRQLAAVTITAVYNPPPDAEMPPERHLDIHYNMSYWMTHILSCAINNDDEPEEENPSMPIDIVPPDLYFTEDNQLGDFAPGYVKQISFDPMYTLAYTTTTDYKEDDLAEQESWVDRLYILTKDIVNSKSFERVHPVPITSIAGYDTETTGCCWLKVRGPVVWTTSRTYECRSNVKTWYMVNQSTKKTYVAHPVMNEETAPEHQGMGFILFEYPEGNIIPPGESRPVTIKWQPIFKPDGEDMTRRTTRPVVRDCQAESVGSIWSTEDGFFNNLLFAMAVGHKNPDTGDIIIHPDYDTEFTHTYVETIFGDGIDIPVRPDQPLHKMDVKQLNSPAYNYNTLTYFDVDVDQVEENFQFLSRAGIWMGVKDDPEANDLPLPLGAKPSDMFDYIEWISPASGLSDVPQYIDHKFKVNPLYTFNGDTPYPYQLAPFNKEYADPYVATMFMGKDTISTKDLANAGYEDWNQYIDPNALIVPCDSSGNETAGWLLQDFWPVSGDRNLSISRLATENDYIFTKTFYAKNKDAVDHQIVLDYDANVINGVSVQGVTVTSNAMCPPGGVASIDISFRLHYTYQESHCVNLVKDILYVPVFLE